MTLSTPPENYLWPATDSLCSAWDISRYCGKRKTWNTGSRLWRRSRDLNPGCALAHYSLSRGAPSATWVLLQRMGHRCGGERGIRTPGALGHHRFSRPAPSTARPSLLISTRPSWACTNIPTQKNPVKHKITVNHSEAIALCLLFRHQVTYSVHNLSSEYDGMSISTGEYILFDRRDVGYSLKR